MAIVRIVVQGAVCVTLAAMGLIPGEVAATAAGVPALIGWLQVTRGARSQGRPPPPALPPPA